MPKANVRLLTRTEKNELAAKICTAIAIEMDKQGIFKPFQVPLPDTDVVFLRGLGMPKDPA